MLVHDVDPLEVHRQLDDRRQVGERQGAHVVEHGAVEGAPPGLVDVRQHGVLRGERLRPKVAVQNHRRAFPLEQLLGRGRLVDDGNVAVEVVGDDARLRLFVGVVHQDLERGEPQRLLFGQHQVVPHLEDGLRVLEHDLRRV